MNEFKLEHFVLVLLLALIVAIAVLAIKKRHDIIAFFKRADVRERIRQLILLAEKEIVGTKKGQERLFFVCSYIWGFLPPSMKSFVTVEMMVNVVNTIFTELAEQMEDGTVKAVDKSI